MEELRHILKEIAHDKNQNMNEEIPLDRGFSLEVLVGVPPGSTNPHGI